MTRRAQPTNPDLELTKQRCRILLLLEALERAGVTPIEARRLHGFAFLADVLSPVWDLPPFDGAILKMKDGPHYADLQQQLDHLVVLGLVNVLDLQYVKRGRSGARVDGKYELRFESDALSGILSALGANKATDPILASDKLRHGYLVELAGALATLPDDEIDIAARQDATYSDNSIANSNVIELGDLSRNGAMANRSVAVTERFSKFMPRDVRLSPGERIYLYASYLREKIHHAG